MFDEQSLSDISIKKKIRLFCAPPRAHTTQARVRRKAIGDPMEPAQTSSFELGVVNHRSTPRFEDDTAARDIFPRANDEDDMDEDVFLPRENGGGGKRGGRTKCRRDSARVSTTETRVDAANTRD